MMKYLRDIYVDGTTQRNSDGKSVGKIGVMGTAIIFKKGFNTDNSILICKTGGKWSLPTEVLSKREKTKDGIARFLKSRFGLDCGELKFITKKNLTRGQRQPGFTGGIEFVFGTIVTDGDCDSECKDYKWASLSKLPRLSYGHTAITRNAAEKLLGVVAESIMEEGDPMIHEKLHQAIQIMDRWLGMNNVEYNIACDEDDLQAFVIPRAHRNLTPKIMGFMEHVCLNNQLHLRHQQTRSGLVIALSLQSIAESTMSALIPSKDQNRLSRRLDLILQPKAGMLGESPFCSPISAHRRQVKFPTRKHGLNEGLKGVAAQFQPGDLLKRMEKAMDDLGLIDALKDAGITNRLSRDGQTIRFFITDAEGRGREVAAYELSQLGDGKAMEQALSDLRDLAKNRSPGSTKRELDNIRNQEKTVKDVAKRYVPKDDPLEGDVPIEGRRRNSLIHNLLAD